MGLFDKFKKKDVVANDTIANMGMENEVTTNPVIDFIDKSSWIKVFSTCLGKMMVIQNNASEYVVKGRNWYVDFEQEYIAFGDDKYPVQFIGSESGVSNTWMWGWNNINNFPENLISLSNEMLRKGEEWNLEPLKIAQFELDDTFNGHNLSIVTCGLSDEKYFYYRGPHAEGAVFMAVGNVPETVFQPIEIKQFVELTMQCIEQFPIDHKIFVESLLQWNKTAYNWDGNTLIANFSKNLHITFEQSGEYHRITAMKTK